MGSLTLPFWNETIRTGSVGNGNLDIRSVTIGRSNITQLNHTSVIVNGVEALRQNDNLRLNFQIVPRNFDLCILHASFRLVPS